MSYYYRNRNLCDVLEEMRKIDETKNYGALAGLIEEAQSMGNRMEAALQDGRDWDKIQKELPKFRKELRKLKDEKEELKPDGED